MKNLTSRATALTALALVSGSLSVANAETMRPVAPTTSSKVATSPAISSCHGAHVVSPKGTSATSEDLAQPGNSNLSSVLKNKSIHWMTSASCTQKKKKVTPTRIKATSKSTVKKSHAAYSGNWSGYAASDPSETSPNYVQTNYVEPNVKYTGGGSLGSVVSFWAGIGGMSGSNQLVQSGTNATAYSNGTQVHYGWYEVFPDEAEQIVNDFPVDAGDHMYTSSGWSNGTSSFVLCNLSKNICTNFQQYNTAQPSNSVEWVTEKPSFSDGSLQPLANFGSVNFSGNYWDQNVWGRLVHGVSDFSSPIIMLGKDNKTTDASPSDVSNNSFSVKYEHAS